MKILKFVGSVVLLGLLGISTASAAGIQGTWDATILDYGSPTPGEFTADGQLDLGSLSFSAAGDYFYMDTESQINNTASSMGFADRYEISVGSGLGLEINLEDLNDQISITDLAWGLFDTLGNLVETGALVTTINPLANGDYWLGIFGTIDEPIGESTSGNYRLTVTAVTAVPIPAAFWLFGSALVGFIGFGRHKAKT